MDIDATQALDLNITEDDDNDNEKKLIGKLITIAHTEMPATEFDVFEGVNIIGRDERSQIQVTVKSLSKKHACIEASTDGSVIYDFDSRNKTRKGNGKMVLKPLVRYEIRDGDSLLFGNLQCKFTEIAQENNSDDDNGSITASESDNEIDNSTNNEKKIVEDDSDEENSPSILTITGNNNDLVKNDELNSSDIVLPTQQKSKKVVKFNNNDENGDSDDSFQNDLQKLIKDTPIKDKAYVVETDDSESEDEDIKDKKDDGQLTIIKQTPGLVLKNNILPESDLDMTLGSPNDKSTQPPDDGPSTTVDPKILFESPEHEPELDNLSCDFSAAVAEDERFADTLPIEDRAKKVESNGTIGRLLAEQFADTVIINKDGLLEENAESDTDCEVEEELEEEDENPDHHGDIIGTYQFDTDNFKKLSGGEEEEEEEEEEVGTKEDKKDEMKEDVDSKKEPVKSFDHDLENTPTSQEVPFSFKTSSRLVEGFGHSFGTPASSINASVETASSLDRSNNAGKRQNKMPKMMASDSEEEEEATQAYNLSPEKPKKDIDGFTVPKLPPKGLSLPGASGTEVFDAVDASTQMTSSEDEGKPVREVEAADDDATQAYGDESTQAYGSMATQAYTNMATQAYADESTQAYTNTATQAYAVESTQAYANMATQPFFVEESNTANDEEEETQAYMGELGLAKPENDSDVTLSDNEQAESPTGEEQIAKEANLLESDTCGTTTKSRIGTKRKTKSKEMEENSLLYEEPEKKKGRVRKSAKTKIETETPTENIEDENSPITEEPKKIRGRGRKSGKTKIETETPAENIEDENSPITEEPTKKRGRGRKSGKTKIKTETPAENIEDENSPITEELTKKRGKGRKSEKTKIETETPAENIEEENSPITEEPTKKQGKGRKSEKTKIETETPAENIEEENSPITEEPTKKRGKGRKSEKTKIETETPAENIEDENSPITEEPTKKRGKGQKSGKTKIETETPAEKMENENSPITEEPTKKRGRGRKSGKTKIETETPAENIEEENSPITEEPTKKRGKGRKSEKTKIETETLAENIEDENSSLTEEPTKKRGKSRKSAKIKIETEAPAEKKPRRSISANNVVIQEKPRILFTGITDGSVEKIVTDLDGILSDNVEQSTHLVTDKVRRTVKFMCALGKGVPIVSPDWLKQSKKNNSFIEHNKFILMDKTAEKQHKFSLRESLEKSRNQPLLTGVHIHVTKSVKPESKQMKEMIECCGGTFVKSAAKLDEKVIVISCEEDSKDHSKFQNNTICSNELLLSGILRQELDLKEFTLVKNNPSPKQSTTKAKGRRKK